MHLGILLFFDLPPTAMNANQFSASVIMRRQQNNYRIVTIGRAPGFVPGAPDFVPGALAGAQARPWRALGAHWARIWHRLEAGRESFFQEVTFVV